MVEASVMVQKRIETYGISDQGCERERNEDSIAIVHAGKFSAPSKGTLLVVADGLGGHNAGDVASRIVTETLPRFYSSASTGSPADDLITAIAFVNQEILRRSERDSSLNNMGSTVVACVIADAILSTVNVGDSRAYLFRDGRLRQLTMDHSLMRESFEFETPRMAGALSGILTQALGVMTDVHAHVSRETLLRDDIILLCTDGLTIAVSDGEIQRILKTVPLAEVPARLVELANERGGLDNTSIIVAEV